MGWVFGFDSKEEALKEALGGLCKIGDSRVVHGRLCRIADMHGTREGVWLLVNREGAPTVILFQHIERRGGQWGFGNQWGEDAGPCASGCPVAWFSTAPLPTVPDVSPQGAKSAAEFRARILSEYAAKNVTRTLKVGDTIMLSDGRKPRGPFQLVLKKSARTWIGRTVEGAQFNLPPRALVGCEVVRRWDEPAA